jgi:hypothetical protein
LFVGRKHEEAMMKSLDDRIWEAEQAYTHEVKVLSGMLLDGSRSEFEVALQGKRMKQAQQRLLKLRAKQRKFDTIPALA